MRLLDLATLLYLAAGLAVLPIARSPAGWPLLVLAHLLAIGMILWLVGNSSKAPAWLREWYPLVLLPVLYAEIPFLNQAFLSTARDQSIQWLEHAVFSSQPARAFAEAAPWRPLSEALHLAYLSYYPIIFGPPLLLYLKRRREPFRETVFTVMLTYYCCYLVFVLLPVRGPWDLWPVSQAPPDGPLRQLATRLLEGGSSLGAAFPSSHQAVAVAQTVCATRHLPRIAPLLGLLSAGIAAGAVYASFHYAVDMLAGALVGLGVALVARRLYTQKWMARC